MNLSPFGPQYSECRNCGTLVSNSATNSECLTVTGDESGFYSKQYWLEHQRTNLASPDIHARARSDLSERNLHWLNTLLKYRLPPASILEIGCGHAGFVAMMHQAGFGATGVELSPWVVRFGTDTFAVPVHLGTIENFDRPASSFDVIVMMDVLEHLPAPTETIKRCFELLKHDGIILVQTPRFKNDRSFEAMLAEHDRFAEMMLPDEHIYLFSERSVTRLFLDFGASDIYFEPAIFAHYDMFFVVSRVPLSQNSRAQIESALLSSAQGRITLALLDLRERELALIEQLRTSESDRAARADQISTLTRMVHESEHDRNARGEQIATLAAMVHEAHAELGAAKAAQDSMDARHEGLIRRYRELRDAIRELLSNPMIRRLANLLMREKLRDLDNELRKPE